MVERSQDWINEKLNPTRIININILLPILPVFCLYLTWWLGRLSLGHWPKPMSDDLSNPNIWMTLSSGFTAIFLAIGLPLSVIVHIGTILYLIFHRDPERRKQVNLEIAALLTLISMFYFLRWDPYSVLEWFFD